MGKFKWTLVLIILIPNLCLALLVPRETRLYHDFLTSFDPHAQPYTLKGANDNAPQPQHRTNEELVFEDTFDRFDLSLWEHELTLGGGGNGEFQLYTNNRTNSYVRDGVLYLRPTLTANRIGDERLHSGYTMDIWGAYPANLCTGNQFRGCQRTSGENNGVILPPIQSARIRTSRSLNVQYGRVEVRAQLPRGDWLWPAIWMLPKWNAYGDWPASGEIDILESQGNTKKGSSSGSNIMQSTLHWGPDPSQNRWNLTHAELILPKSLTESFHTYGLYWDDTKLFTYLDTEAQTVLHVQFDIPFYTRGKWTTFDNPWRSGSNAAPFDQEFYLILNVAVGGNSGYFPDSPEKPWRNGDPKAPNTFYAAIDQWGPTWCTVANPESCALKVDSVRVWKRSKSTLIP